MKILYYAPFKEPTIKYFTLLVNYGFNVVKCKNKLELIQNITGTALILTTQEDILELIQTLDKTVPVVVLSNPDEILKYTVIPNKVFYRTNSDPILTILETVKFLLKT